MPRKPASTSRERTRKLPAAGPRDTAPAQVVIAPLSVAGPSSTASPAVLAEAPAGTLSLTPVQKRICERVLNVFETGSPDGNYGAISIYKDGPNEIRQVTYGRSQTTEYGNLRELVAMYVGAKGEFSEDLRPFVSLIGRTPLVDHSGFKQLLRAAGKDPVMHATQDEFFDRRYFLPAMKWAGRNGFTLGLSALVIYDSFIHSGGVLDLLRTRFPERPPAQGGREKRWIEQYVEARHTWLASHSRTILRSTIYRTRCFQSEIARGNWDLKKLPIMANGVAVGDAPDSKAAISYSEFIQVPDTERLPYLGSPEDQGRVLDAM